MSASELCNNGPGGHPSAGGRLDFSTQSVQQRYAATRLHGGRDSRYDAKKEPGEGLPLQLHPVAKGLTYQPTVTEEGNPDNTRIPPSRRNPVTTIILSRRQQRFPHFPCQLEARRVVDVAFAVLGGARQVHRLRDVALAPPAHHRGERSGHN